MKEKILNNLGWVIAVLDIGIYFILSYVFVSDFQTNILAVIVNSMLFFLGAIIANSALMKQGMLRGRNTADYKSTLASHISQKQKVYPKLKFLQPWLNYDYNKLMRMGRTVLVNSAGYDYDQLFTDEGKVKELTISKPKPLENTKTIHKLTAWLRNLTYWAFGEDWKIYREKKRFIRRAKHYKVTRLTVSHLMNIDSEKDPNNFGMTERRYTRTMNTSTVITRLILAIGIQSISFGFYGFNMETFLIQMLNVVLILISSLFSMYNAYFFMVKTHRETIIKKINKLEEFENADLTEFKKENTHEQIHSTQPVPAQSGVVQEAYKQIEYRPQGDLSGNANAGV